MQLILFFLALLYTTCLFGQNTAKGTVKDLESGNAIAYVNIGILSKNVGTVSNVNGEFELGIPTDLNNDSVKLSCVGYKPKIMIASELLAKLEQNPTIALAPDVRELKELVVTGRKLKEKRLGNKTKSGFLRGGFRYATLGHELGTKINIKRIPTYIRSFHTHIVENTSETMKFRMNFYSIKRGLPYKRIVNKQVIFSIDVREGPFTLDLAEFNIVVNEDFYCTIELIENQKPEDILFFSAGFLGNKMAYRPTSHGEWEKIGAIGIGFNVTAEY